jgi:calcineurin-like phosphoesterase
MVSDIVGPEAVAYLAGRLPGLRRTHELDLVVANAENCALTAPTPWTGFGMTVELVERLLESGVDVVTSGNHGWDGPEADSVHRHPRVLWPLNLPKDVIGKGILTLEGGGETVGTALVVDVGMTGPSGRPAGFPLTYFAAKMRSEDTAFLPPFELADGPITLGAVLLRIVGGKTSHIERITWPETGGGR